MAQPPEQDWRWFFISDKLVLPPYPSEEHLTERLERELAEKEAKQLPAEMLVDIGGQEFVREYIHAMIHAILERADISLPLTRIPQNTAGSSSSATEAYPPATQEQQPTLANQQDLVPLAAEEIAHPSCASPPTAAMSPLGPDAVCSLQASDFVALLGDFEVPISEDSQILSEGECINLLVSPMQETLHPSELPSHSHGSATRVHHVHAGHDHPKRTHHPQPAASPRGPARTDPHAHGTPCRQVFPLARQHGDIHMTQHLDAASDQDKTHFYQLRVVQQTKNPSCGYYALHLAMLYLDLITTRSDSKAATTYPLFTDRCYFWLHQHAMKKELKKHSKKLDRGQFPWGPTFIDGGIMEREYMAFLEEKIAQRHLVPKWARLLCFPEGGAMLDGSGSFHSQVYVFSQAVQDFRAGRVQCILLCLGAVTHWFSLCISRLGSEVECVMMDTLNKPILNATDEQLWKIVEEHIFDRHHRGKKLQPSEAYLYYSEMIDARRTAERIVKCVVGKEDLITSWFWAGLSNILDSFDRLAPCRASGRPCMYHCPSASCMPATRHPSAPSTVGLGRQDILGAAGQDNLGAAVQDTLAPGKQDSAATGVLLESLAHGAGAGQLPLEGREQDSAGDGAPQDREQGRTADAATGGSRAPGADTQALSVHEPEQDASAAISVKPSGAGLGCRDEATEGGPGLDCSTGLGCNDGGPGSVGPETVVVAGLTLVNGEVDQQDAGPVPFCYDPMTFSGFLSSKYPPSLIEDYSCNRIEQHQGSIAALAPDARQRLEGWVDALEHLTRHPDYAMAIAAEVPFLERFLDTITHLRAMISQ